MGDVVIFGIFIQFPWLATLIGTGFLLAWRNWRKHRSLLLPASAWITCSVYEALIQADITCSNECNIRIDALLIYPALAIISLLPFIQLALNDLIGVQKGGSRQ